MGCGPLPPERNGGPGEVNQETETNLYKNRAVVTIEVGEVSAFAKNECHRCGSSLSTIWPLANKNKNYATRLLTLTCETITFYLEKECVFNEKEFFVQNTHRVS